MTDDLEKNTTSSSNSASIKKVNSRVNMDEKTGKIVSSSTSSSDFASNFDNNNKTIASKELSLQSSNSLPDLQSSQKSTPSSNSSATISSNSNNLVHGNGKHVILAVETQELNKVDGSNDCGAGGDVGQVELQILKNMKMNFNIDPTSNGSSSSTSSNNIECTIGSNSTL